MDGRTDGWQSSRQSVSLCCVHHHHHQLPHCLTEGKRLIIREGGRGRSTHRRNFKIGRLLSSCRIDEAGLSTPLTLCLIIGLYNTKTFALNFRCASLNSTSSWTDDVSSLQQRGGLSCRLAPDNYGGGCDDRPSQERNDVARRVRNCGRWMSRSRYLVSV